MDQGTSVGAGIGVGGSLSAIPSEQSNRTHHACVSWLKLKRSFVLCIRTTPGPIVVHLYQTHCGACIAEVGIQFQRVRERTPRLAIAREWARCLIWRVTRAADIARRRGNSCARWR